MTINDFLDVIVPYVDYIAFMSDGLDVNEWDLSILVKVDISDLLPVSQVARYMRLRIQAIELLGL